MRLEYLGDGATQKDSMEAMRLQMLVSTMNPTIQKFAKSLRHLPNPAKYYAILKFAFDSAFYEEDTSDLQTVRDALRLIEDKRANCVDYSVFIGSFLQLLNIPFILRMVSFGKPDEWTHIYIITADGYCLDAVLGQDMDGNEFKLRNDKKPVFNKEVPYKYKLDLKL